MSPWLPVGLSLGGLTLGSAFVGWQTLRRKGLHRWLLPYLLSSGQRRLPKKGEPVELILAVCDHYEPKRGNASPEKARARVQQWVDEYPRLFDRFRDAEGKPPQHTFFYPADEYEPELVEMVAGLCKRGYGEVEIHLHHDNDTPENFRKTLIDFKTALHERHGLLSKNKRTGEVSYGFIHGNWALNNSRSDGRWCGINNEIDILRETGCYADFTYPSAPSETQPKKINKIYWAVGDDHRPKSHNRGVDLGWNSRPEKALLMIPGPLLLDWKTRKRGIIPKIENSCLQRNQTPDTNRVDSWLRARITPPNFPSWYFVKLHCHGVNEPSQDALLGEPMVKFHEELKQRSRDDSAFRFHYVTAREMANLALVSESVGGTKIEIGEARSFRYSL